VLVRTTGRLRLILSAARCHGLNRTGGSLRLDAYFHYDDKAEVTLNAILAYDPTIPSWGYNGSARRYWISSTAVIPNTRVSSANCTIMDQGLMLFRFLRNIARIPTISICSVSAMAGDGPLSNIDEKGFASAAFHSFPDRMMFDPYTGDYGPTSLDMRSIQAHSLRMTMRWDGFALAATLKIVTG